MVKCLQCNVCVYKLFLQARFKDKGSEMASEQLSQVFTNLLPCLHMFDCFV